MVPETVLCRCGASLPLMGGFHRFFEDRQERRFIWLGASCECGFIVQYGLGGDRFDYRHCRWHYLGQMAEIWAGAPRRWPSAWSISLPFCGEFSSAVQSPHRPAFDLGS